MQKPCDVAIGPGEIGIMLDVPEAGSIKLIIAADELDDTLAQLDTLYANAPGGLHSADLQWHADRREELANVMRQMSQTPRAHRDSNMVRNCGLFALWLLFNHPISTEGRRRALGRELREENRAYITIVIDQQGHLVDAVGSQFDLQLRQHLAWMVAQEVSPELNDIEIERQVPEPPMH